MPADPRNNLAEREAMFAQIYQQYHTAVFNYVYFRVGDKHLVEDLTADVFVRLVEKYDLSSRGGRPILPWLYTIARNLVIDHQRRKKRVQWSSLESVHLATPATATGQAVQERLTSECLSRALGYLNEEQRRVILLKFIERRKNAEIAQVLGKSEGAVKALQHRALRALRMALNKEQCYEG